jgi:polyisoprenoid-binding protein YceI
VHPIHAETDGLEGYVDVEFSPGGEVDLSAPMSGRLSLAVDRLKSGNRLEDRELQKRIDARRFPTITGVLGAVEKADAAGSYRVSGDIMFKGVSCHAEDVMTISINGPTVQLDGSSRFDMREWGLEPPRMLMAKVEPEIAIRVEIVALRESGA